MEITCNHAKWRVNLTVHENSISRKAFMSTRYMYTYDPETVQRRYLTRKKNFAQSQGNSLFFCFWPQNHTLRTRPSKPTNGPVIRACREVWRFVCVLCYSSRRPAQSIWSTIKQGQDRLPACEKKVLLQCTREWRKLKIPDGHTGLIHGGLKWQPQWAYSEQPRRFTDCTGYVLASC